MGFIIVWLGMLLSMLTQCTDSFAFSTYQQSVPKGEMLEIVDWKDEIKSWVYEEIGIPKELRFDNVKFSGSHFESMHISYNITF
jgi:hypothetical protein